jgi:hypothetical protein
MSTIVTASQFKEYLAINVQPPSLPPGAPSPPKHALFLFDTSGSMAEEDRMESLKNTMNLLITKKPSSYKFSFIAYSSTARTVALAEENPTKLNDAIAALHPDAGTNLEVALLEIRKVLECGILIDTIILFTDGHVNEGAIRKSSGFIALMKGLFETGLPPIHTIGCGANYNQRFLKHVADQTRSIHFYADSAETMPAVVADILEGMRTEMGRKTQCAIPDGWINAECGKDADRIVTLGPLIADHGQWILLKAVIETATPPDITISYVPTDSTAPVSISCSVTESIPPIQIAQQIARVRIATVYNEVWDLLEEGPADPTPVVSLLTNLVTELGTSLASKTDFVLTACAQIEEMKETIVAAEEHMPRPGVPTGPPGLMRTNSASRMPSGPPVMSRLASNTAALTNQRGFFSRMSSGPPDQSYTFSSPSQQRAQREISQPVTNVLTE